MSEKILEGLREAVWYFDECEVKRLSEEGVEAGLDPVEVLEGLSKALREVGNRFGNGEIFITELIASAQAMEVGAEILNREITKRGVTRKSVGKFLIGTVEGDIHSIGKNIVKTMLTAVGFEVIDLGTDVKSGEIVEKVKEHKPDILGLSSLMTTTIGKQKEVIDELKKARLRESIKVIVGGAPVTEAWVEEIGADACGLDAGSAVKKSLKLMEA